MIRRLTELKKHKCVKTREYLDIREKYDKIFSGQEISNLPFEKNEFDTITCTFGLRNVENINKAIIFQGPL